MRISRTVTEVCKFLAGAFFVSAGILFYLSAVHVSVPLMGTAWIQTPAVSRARAIVHACLFALTFYAGFVRRSPRAPR
jgi:hypothetical protein